MNASQKLYNQSIEKKRELIDRGHTEDVSPWDIFFTNLCERTRSKQLVTLDGDFSNLMIDFNDPKRIVFCHFRLMDFLNDGLAKKMKKATITLYSN